MLAWQASAGDGEDAGAGVRWADEGRDGATKDATCQVWRWARRRGGGGVLVAARMRRPAGRPCFFSMSAFHLRCPHAQMRHRTPTRPAVH